MQITYTFNFRTDRYMSELNVSFVVKIHAGLYIVYMYFGIEYIYVINVI